MKLKYFGASEMGDCEMARRYMGGGMYVCTRTGFTVYAGVTEGRQTGFRTALDAACSAGTLVYKTTCSIPSGRLNAFAGPGVGDIDSEIYSKYAFFFDRSR